MFVCSLGSGSSGNATVVRNAVGRTILIDCGVAPARLSRNLKRLDLTPADIEAVVLTHEHSDHTQAAALLHEQWHTPILAAPETLAAAAWLEPFITDTFLPDATWTFGDMTLEPCRVAHDASGTYGFVVHADGCTAAIFTDLGSGAEGVTDCLSRADLIVLEANYDREMLQNGPYPWFLKARIAGRNGHLANDQCAALLLRAFADDRPREIWLAHLSEKNNDPALAVATVTTALHEAGIHHARVAALPRYTIGPIWQAIRHRQLALFPE